MPSSAKLQRAKEKSATKQTQETIKGRTLSHAVTLSRAATIDEVIYNPHAANECIATEPTAKNEHTLSLLSLIVYKIVGGVMSAGLSDELYLSFSRHLLGEVYWSIRAIAVAFRGDTFLIRYYIDREVVEKDEESIYSLVDYLDTDSVLGDLPKSKEECIYSLAPFDKLDSLDGFMYARKESGSNAISLYHGLCDGVIPFEQQPLRWLCAGCFKALLGQVTPELRAVLADYLEGNIVHLLFIFEREPTTGDHQNMKEVARDLTYVMPATDAAKVASVRFTCQCRTDGPLGRLLIDENVPGELCYLRREDEFLIDMD